MNKLTKISLLVFSLIAITDGLNAMNQNASCMSKTCMFLNCCLADLSEVLDFGEQTLEIVLVADPRVADKAILSTLVALFKTISPELLALANACKNEANKISAEDQVKLKALNLIDANGQVTNPKVISTVNACVKVTQKET